MKVDVIVIRDRCKGCGICVSVCQTGVLELEGEKNNQGMQTPSVVHPENCLNCGLCEMFCPDFAIWATSDLDEAVS